jgi:hypothetical protein
MAVAEIVAGTAIKKTAEIKYNDLSASLMKYVISIHNKKEIIYETEIMIDIPVIAGIEFIGTRITKLNILKMTMVKIAKPVNT